MEEYLAYEAIANVRSEYWEGLVIPILGGYLAHSQIIMTLNSLNQYLTEQGHEVLGEGIRIKVGDREYAYSDGCVVFGKPDLVFDGVGLPTC